MIIVCILLMVWLAVVAGRNRTLERQLTLERNENGRIYGAGWLDGYFHHRAKVNHDRDHIARCYAKEVE